MKEVTSVRWMVTFYHSEGRWRDEPDFPKVSFWHPNKKASMEEGARILQELKDSGDNRGLESSGSSRPPRSWLRSTPRRSMDTASSAAKTFRSG